MQLYCIISHLNTIFLICAFTQYTVSIVDELWCKISNLLQTYFVIQDDHEYVWLLYDVTPWELLFYNIFLTFTTNCKYTAQIIRVSVTIVAAFHLRYRNDTSLTLLRRKFCQIEFQVSVLTDTHLSWGWESSEWRYYGVTTISDETAFCAAAAYSELVNLAEKQET